MSPRTPAAALPPLTERAAAGLLCLGALVAPLALGSTGPLARFGLETLTAAAAIMWAVSAHCASRSLLLPAGISAIMLLQLVPLPVGIPRQYGPGLCRPVEGGPRREWRLVGATISVVPGTTAMAI